MDFLRIDRLERRYHLPRSARGAEARLDRIVNAACAGLLELALLRSGISPQEELCVRHLDVRARFRLGASDTALALEWSLAFTEGLMRAIGAGDVVRYRSRRAACFDMVRRALAGDLARAWAWQQLGLWTDADADTTASRAAAVVRVLLAAPESIVAVLAEIAPSASFVVLFAAAPSRAWAALANEAAACAGVDANARAATEVYARHSRPEPPTNEMAARHAEHVAACSRIGRALTTAVAAAPGGRVDWRPLAMLAILEVEPALLRVSGNADGLVGQVEALLRAGGSAVLPPGGARQLGAPQAACTPSAPPPPHFGAPELLRAEGQTAGRSHAAAGVRASTTIAPARGEHPSPTAAPAAEVSGGRRDSAPNGDDETNRPVAFTRAGGLPFLLHVVAALELPDSLPVDPALAARPLRWTLHQVALTLLDLPEDDAAVLAFAGLRPIDEPPSRALPPGDASERARLSTIATEITAALAVRLETPDQGPAALLRGVCLRPAHVVADPGWIEVRLSLSDVTTEIRRAGIDLDPGYIPWLGVVMRFIYG